MEKEAPLCENCEYYDYDEDYDGYVCTQSFDQDEMESLVRAKYTACPFFKFYDEYKSVQKQN